MTTTSEFVSPLNLCKDSLLTGVFQDGETYNRWQAYGQSKTANMLMAVSLAEKLGSRGLTAFSLHPGTIMTHLGEHIDFSVEFATLGRHFHLSLSIFVYMYLCDCVYVLTMYGGIAAADRLLGNAEGWLTEFDFKTPDRGVATHIYAAFEPSLKGIVVPCSVCLLGTRC